MCFILNHWQGWACRKAWNGHHQAPLPSVPWLTSVSLTEPESTQAPITAQTEHSSLRHGREKSVSSISASQANVSTQPCTADPSFCFSQTQCLQKGKAATRDQGEVWHTGLLVSGNCLLFPSFPEPYFAVHFPQPGNPGSQ